MTEIRDWSITASANTGNAVDGFFKEGMNYSEVNDAARETQAILARADKDRNGTLVSTGSTGSYIVAINANLSAYNDGDLVAFQAHAKNDGATTLRLRMPDGASLSDRPVVKTDLSALEDGDIVVGGTYMAFYKSASANWQIQGVPMLPEDGNFGGDVSVSGSVSIAGDLFAKGDVSVSGSLSIKGFAQPVIEAKYKTANEDVTNSDTLQADDHLTGLTLADGGVYALDAHFSFTAVADAPGVKFDFNMGANPADSCWFQVTGYDSAGNEANDVLVLSTGVTSSDNYATSAFDDSAEPQITVSGIVYAPSGGGTLQLRWAQNVSSATTLFMQAGSYITLTRLA